MKVQEIRDLSPEDLKARIDDTRKEIVELRFQMAAHKLESPTRLRLARRSLSRLLTIQGQAGTAQSAPAPKKEKTDSKENVKASKPKAKKQ